MRPAAYSYEKSHRGNPYNPTMTEKQSTNPEAVIGFEALYESNTKCHKGVMWKDSVARYSLNAMKNSSKLENELKTGQYKERPTVQFKVKFPKERDILSIAYRDRIYQRSLNDNVVYPEMIRHFIYENCACQKGRGTDFARELLKKRLREYFRRNGTDGYVLQIDIKGYYPNMRHEVAKETFRKYLDDWSYDAVVRILDEQYKGDVGFNPGSQIIQIAGISVLNDIDHYIKERLRIRAYVRYMDDLILIYPDKDYLQACREEIGKKLDDLGFQYNDKKTRIYRITDGIKFLGFTWKLTDKGKVISLIDPKNVKARRKKLVRLIHMEKDGRIKKGKVSKCQESWKAHALQKAKKSHNRKKGIAQTHRMMMRMDEFVKSVREEDYEHDQKKVKNVDRRVSQTGAGNGGRDQ